MDERTTARQARRGVRTLDRLTLSPGDGRRQLGGRRPRPFRPPTRRHLDDLDEAAALLEPAERTSRIVRHDLIRPFGASS